MQGRWTFSTVYICPFNVDPVCLFVKDETEKEMAASPSLPWRDKELPKI